MHSLDHRCIGWAQAPRCSGIAELAERCATPTNALPRPVWIGSRSVLARLGLNMVEAERAVFEFEDHQDRLAEASPRSKHRTQVDVALRGTRQTAIVLPL